MAVIGTSKFSFTYQTEWPSTISTSWFSFFCPSVEWWLASCRSLPMSTGSTDAIPQSSRALTVSSSGEDREFRTPKGRKSLTVFELKDGMSIQYQVCFCLVYSDSHYRATGLIGITAVLILLRTRLSERDVRDFANDTVSQCDIPGPAKKFFADYKLKRVLLK